MYTRQYRFHPYMPLVGFESTIALFKRTKVYRILDCTSPWLAFETLCMVYFVRVSYVLYNGSSLFGACVMKFCRNQSSECTFPEDNDRACLLQMYKKVANLPKCRPNLPHTSSIPHKTVDIGKVIKTGSQAPGNPVWLPRSPSITWREGLWGHLSPWYNVHSSCKYVPCCATFHQFQSGFLTVIYIIFYKSYTSWVITTFSSWKWTDISGEHRPNFMVEEYVRQEGNMKQTAERLVSCLTSGPEVMFLRNVGSFIGIPGVISQDRTL